MEKSEEICPLRFRSQRQIGQADQHSPGGTEPNDRRRRTTAGTYLRYPIIGFEPGQLQLYRASRMSESKTQLKFDPRYVQEYLLDESEIATRLLSPVYVSGRILLRDYAGLAEEQIPAYVAKFVSYFRLCPRPVH